MLKKVIVHAKFNKLLEFKDEQVEMHFDNIDELMDDSILFYKLENESLKLELSDTNLDVYYCKFSERQTHDHAFFKGENIPYIDIVHSFKAFVCEKTNVIFFNINTEIGNKFVKKYNSKLRKNKYMPIETFPVNFDYIQAKAKEVTGSWFSKDGGLVTSQGLMGNKIENSIEYTGLKKTSKISSLTVTIYLPEIDNDLKVIISNKGSLYIQNKVPEQYNPVDILWILFVNLILPDISH